jgi:folate-binding Fe-S cluster repair protein YgfZ
MSKGCYRGQETVAKVYNLGRPPRRLVLLHLDGSMVHMPEHGAKVSYEGKEIGQIGSMARHFELGPIALAVIKRSVPSGATLDIDGVSATQEVLVAAE